MSCVAQPIGGLLVSSFVLISLSIRFTSNGWNQAFAVDMMTVYNSLPAADVHR